LRGNVVLIVNRASRFEHKLKEVVKRTSIVIKDNDGDSVKVDIVVDVVNEKSDRLILTISSSPTS
jgi:hypothetical protein